MRGYNNLSWKQSKLPRGDTICFTLFNLADTQMLETLKLNNEARLSWRARRKEDAHRGRAVLRAAKKALDQAAVRVVDIK